MKSWIGIGIVLCLAFTDVHAQNPLQSVCAPLLGSAFVFIAAVLVCSRIKGNVSAPTDTSILDQEDY